MCERGNQVFFPSLDMNLGSWSLQGHCCTSCSWLIQPWAEEKGGRKEVCVFSLWARGRGNERWLAVKSSQRREGLPYGMAKPEVLNCHAMLPEAH